MHDFDCLDRCTGGLALGLETIAVCHEKHYLVLGVLENVTEESDICDTIIN